MFRVPATSPAPYSGSMKKTQLSPNFYLHEFTRSQAAARHGIDLDVPLGGQVHLNITNLCEQVLQPARDALGPIFISSGYRPRELNAAIGGSPSSYHIHGLAADISVVGLSPLNVARWFEQSGLPFEQVIHEFGQWVHVSIPKPGQTPRRQLLTAVRKPGRTCYVLGIHSVEDALEELG